MMKVTMLLADSAQAVAGKLYILGAGWSITASAPNPQALALKIDVPWTEANKKHHLMLELVDTDDKPVMIAHGETPNQVEMKPLKLELDFEVGRPAGIKPGTSLDFVAAINLGPIPLQPDNRYIWRLFLNGEHQQEWEVAFTTRPL